MKKAADRFKAQCLMPEEVKKFKNLHENLRLQSQDYADEWVAYHTLDTYKRFRPKSDYARELEIYFATERAKKFTFNYEVDSVSKFLENPMLKGKINKEYDDLVKYYHTE